MGNENRNGLLIGLGGFMFIVITTIIVLVSSYISASNYGAKTEANLNAALENNKNILAQYQQKILEAAQVPSMYKDDLKEVLAGAMTGRYGPNGSQATMQWINEHNLSFDSKLYGNLQDIIVAGRNDFQNGQTRMIDIKRDYEANLNYFWRGMFLRMSGYPKLDLSKFVPIITDRVETTYQTGKESAPLKLR